MYTPGPWHIGEHGAVVTFTPDAQVEIKGEHAAETIAWYSGHVICETVTPANARLIAAAPDLLAACRAALIAGIMDIPGRDSIVELAQKAIAKAEGK